MSLVNIFKTISFIILAIVVHSHVLVASAQTNCDAISSSLDEKTARLSEYVSALHNAHREKDYQFMKALNGQIDQALMEIRALEKSIAECPKRSGELKSPISSVKTQDDKFADLGCDDLRKKHIQLSRKFNTLARRQQSVLSEVTAEQKAEYRDTDESLKLVESELRRRCAPSPPAPGQRKTRPIDRNFR